MNHCNGCYVLRTELDRTNGYLQQCHRDIQALERKLEAKDAEIDSLRLQLRALTCGGEA